MEFELPFKDILYWKNSTNILYKKEIKKRK